MTIRDLLHTGAAHLAAAGVPSPEVDARELLLFALGLSPTALLTRGQEAAPASGAERYAALLAQRAQRIPLQHLLPEVEWGGVRLRCDPRALVPRPETEWLLHLTLEALRGTSAPRVADVGTGTGALALGLKAARPDAHVRATDLSPGALSLARENAALNGLEVEFLEADLLTGVSGPLDLVVSNPPYLPDADRAGAQPEVGHDPVLALYGGPDGLDIARRLAAQASGGLKAGGWLLLELDPRNAATFAQELRRLGWSADTAPDLTGRERFVLAQRPHSGA
ncbi:peptide chain release factor N(5)-glutamine methyltransferase [Deinococcus sp. HMF7604]|uniref:peptide chain release factor N(5)-glutamine methyltransferase n=1 Tax=Deinococcus betulae TaxID=2873312 RepID=UPI001CCF805E|nr:peptide chain release factor N(5)-glutamine methyltransferase [Deinococcus betulae]MBZ9751843.1 peptide chain release factor N(5)-glutamine methyltransferase [Deinococcus betulae]